MKHISKTFAYLIKKNIWIEKIAKLLSHSILLIHMGLPILVCFKRECNYALNSIIVTVVTTPDA